MVLRIAVLDIVDSLAIVADVLASESFDVGNTTFNLVIRRFELCDRSKLPISGGCGVVPSGVAPLDCSHTMSARFLQQYITPGGAGRDALRLASTRNVSTKEPAEPNGDTSEDEFLAWQSVLDSRSTLVIRGRRADVSS